MEKPWTRWSTRVQSVDGQALRPTRSDRRSARSFIGAPRGGALAFGCSSNPCIHCNNWTFRPASQSAHSTKPSSFPCLQVASPFATAVTPTRVSTNISSESRMAFLWSVTAQLTSTTRARANIGSRSRFAGQCSMPLAQQMAHSRSRRTVGALPRRQGRNPIQTRCRTGETFVTRRSARNASVSSRAGSVFELAAKNCPSSGIDSRRWDSMSILGSTLAQKSWRYLLLCCPADRGSAGHPPPVCDMKSRMRRGTGGQNSGHRCHQPPDLHQTGTILALYNLF